MREAQEAVKSSAADLQLTPAPFLLSWLSLGSPGTSSPSPVHLGLCPAATLQLLQRKTGGPTLCGLGPFPTRKYPCLTLYFPGSGQAVWAGSLLPSLRAPYPHPHPQNTAPSSSCSALGVTSPCGALLSVSTALTCPSTCPGLAFKPFLPVITRDCPTARPSGLFSVLVTSLMSWRLSHLKGVSLTARSPCPLGP